ncbi:MAG: tyrosine phenol-lyase [Acidobacteria bacterium]|nr:MAG: tyrosine phenol-lyase [Acidobacteriota bacterium]
MKHKILIEPFKIKSVEPINYTTFEMRKEMLEKAKYNVFLLHAKDVMIDLLTDSGTGAMSAQQWGAIMTGDESYAGADSFYQFRDTIRDIFTMEEVIPTHQGRAAERLLFGHLCKSGQIVPNNTHFDTTRANIEYLNVEARDIVIPEARDCSAVLPFKGNMDIGALESLLAEQADNVPFIMITITNNSGGGQPVSLANMKAIRKVADKYRKPIYVDSARFAENAYFIKMREEGQQDKSPIEIAREFFSMADGALMSAKKDGMGNIGGFVALRDKKIADEVRTTLILTEGFPTYGGLAGRDLSALSLGLYEALDEHYLEYRIRTSEYMAEKLRGLGIPIMEPPGGHAIYVDAKAMLPHIEPLQFPGQSLACALYLQGGIRAVEIGSVMFGAKDEEGNPMTAPNELVRMAFPRRVYTQAHFDYVAEVLGSIKKIGDKLPGMRITMEPPYLRHFTSHFEPTNPFPNFD